MRRDQAEDVMSLRQACLADARATFDAVLAIEERVKSSVLPVTQTARAELEVDQRAWTAAIAYAEQAIANFETAGGADNPELWRPLVLLARAKLGAGDKPAAVPLLERAFAIAEHAGMGEYELRPLREPRARL